VRGESPLRYSHSVRISVGADDRGPLPDFIVEKLSQMGHDILLHGDPTGTHEEYVDVAEQVARDVAEGRVDQGIVMCWTGTGVSMAANKVPGVRAALCHDAETARGARRWNHANVLALSMRATTGPLAQEILEAWFSEPFGTDPIDHENVAKLQRLDESRTPSGVP
jgi:RpiB/LacA/LacB family sugar-phosphate isomerase